MVAAEVAAEVSTLAAPQARSSEEWGGAVLALSRPGPRMEEEWRGSFMNESSVRM